MTNEASEENVRVAVRCRPLLDNEKEDACVEIEDDSRTICLANREFMLDRVFGTESTQIDVYTQSAQVIVDFVLQGYNGTIFIYGQTGTGKTFTASGILSHSFAHLFAFIAKSANDTQFLVRASYYEIYNEEIRDLLSKGAKSLELKESNTTGVYVKDLSCYVVNNVAELEKLKEMGDKQRQIASTNMNRNSSRSHTVFTITVEMIKTGEEGNAKGLLRVGKLNLVDLAGSERQSKTGTSGDRLKEAAKINLSLTSLSLVIAALTDPKATHIPYRNSKLTRLLSDSLGGNSKTLLIACIGPAKINLDESISTLRFACTTKRIKNRAKINEDAKDALLRKFQEQISELRRQLEEELQESEEQKVLHGNVERNAETKEGNKESGVQVNCDLLEKLKALETKVIVGGENLLEKAELQEKLLAASEAELKERKVREQQLKLELEKKQAEILQIEESYGTLQEEVTAVNKKLKKVFSFLTSAKSELGDMQSEYGKLREEILETIRATNKEIKLANFIINSYIPDDFLELIQDSTKYNEYVGEWQLKCIAYTGNNLIDPFKKEESEEDQSWNDMENVYLKFD